jgi:hypothetical protein
MDIRLIHRGSSDAEMDGACLDDSSSILLSTVFAARNAPLTRAMALGNASRLADWEEQHATPNR